MHSTCPMISVSTAEAEVQRYFKIWHIPQDVPVRMERIAQKADATIISTPGLLRFGIQGGTGKNPYPQVEKRFAIYIDQSVYDGPQAIANEVFAEETAHIIYDSNELLVVRTLEDVIELHQRPDWIKRESNRESIARVFLMPSFLLLKEIRPVYQQVASREGWGPDLLDHLVCELATRFCVTFDTVIIRIKETGDLLNRIYTSIVIQSPTLVSSADMARLISPKGYKQNNDHHKTMELFEYAKLDE